jgi:Mce-associated membrane protein
MRRRSILVLAALTLVALGVAGFAWQQRKSSVDAASAGRACAAAASAAAQAIFSYDYRSFDSGVAAAKSWTTGEFAKEYGQTTAALKATAVREQAVVQAQVSAVGVLQASTDTVELLVYLDQYRRNTNISGEKVDQNRVLLTMVRLGHSWRVSHATAL